MLTIYSLFFAAWLFPSRRTVFFSFFLWTRISKTKAKQKDKVSRIINKHNEIRSKYQWKIKSLHSDSLHSFYSSCVFFSLVRDLFLADCMQKVAFHFVCYWPQNAAKTGCCCSCTRTKSLGFFFTSRSFASSFPTIFSLIIDFCQADTELLLFLDRVDSMWPPTNYENNLHHKPEHINKQKITGSEKKETTTEN